MGDTFDATTRSRIMALIKSKNTSPEIKVRRAIHAAGFRYQLHRKDLPGTPDLVFPRFRLIVFVHGCFWHWHGCKRSRMPSTNHDYWTAKIERNVKRDAVDRTRLDELGWQVHVVWECQLDVGIHDLLGELAGKRIDLDNP